MEELSALVLLVFMFYLGSSLVRRFFLISDRSKLFLICYLLFTFVFTAFYLFNLYTYNNGDSLSYGSDSSFFEDAFSSISREGFNSEYFEFLSSERKGFTFFVFAPLAVILDSQVALGLSLFLINLVTYFVSLVTIIHILEIVGCNNSRKNLIYSLIFIIPAPLILISFLRDVYVIFFVVEVIYAFLVFRFPLYRIVVISLSLLCLLNLRDFLAYALLFSILIHYTATSKNKILMAFSFASVFLSLAVVNWDNLSIPLGRLLILGEADAYKINIDMLKLDTESFYFGDYSVGNLLFLSLLRFALGSIKFFLSPVFSSYVNFFLQGGSFGGGLYQGYEFILYNLLYAFSYNAVIFPALLGHLMSFRNNWKIADEGERWILGSMLVVLGSIVAVYSIKFLGSRNLKIDFIFAFFALLILGIGRVNMRWFLVGIVLMSGVNLFVVSRFFL